MGVSRYSLTEALRQVGRAEVFVGDPFAVGGGGMELLALKEGDVVVNEPYETNALTLPEYTGGVEHDTTVTLGPVTVTIPIVNGQADVYDKISPVGDGSGGGWDFPQPVVPTSVLIVPLSELAADGTLSYGGGPPAVWAPAAPVHAIMLWKAYPIPERTTFGYDNGGKRMDSVTFRAMLRMANPNGHKVFSRGGAAMAAVDGFAL